MKAILNADLPLIDAILEGKHNLKKKIIFFKFLEIPTCELNKCDPNGNSPLLMAVKLAHKNEAFQDVIKNILKAGGNPKIKDSNGWTPLDESITQVIKTKTFNYKFII